MIKRRRSKRSKRSKRQNISNSIIYMQVIILAIVFAVLFYSWNAIKSGMIGIGLFSQASNNNASRVGKYGYMWFWTLVLINCILLAFSTWFYFTKKAVPGDAGRKGFPGLPGDDYSRIKNPDVGAGVSDS